MRAFSLAGVMMIGACASAVVSTAAASPILDANYSASYTGGSVVAQRQSVAQTFTVVNSGFMTSASVRLTTTANANADLTLQIRALLNGVPSELSSGPTVLATATTLASSFNSYSTQWVDFDFSDFAVTSGEVLAVTLTSATTAGEFVWQGDYANSNFGVPAGTYSGGRAFTEGTSAGHLTWGYISSSTSPSEGDLAFRTFVDSSPAATAVPEPTSLALLAAAMVGVGVIRRRRAA